MDSVKKLLLQSVNLQGCFLLAGVINVSTNRNKGKPARMRRTQAAALQRQGGEVGHLPHTEHGEEGLLTPSESCYSPGEVVQCFQFRARYFSRYC